MEEYEITGLSQIWEDNVSWKNVNIHAGGLRNLLSVPVNTI